tara:strand:+ start:164 stop:730 length:567 start_codon:yes stop_codon:yes gene_type:complete
LNAIILALFTTFLGFASLWLLDSLEEEARTIRTYSSDEPDYYLENMFRTTTGADGRVRNILRAPLVEHFPGDDSMELDRPHLEIYGKEEQPWQVVADKGWISSGNEVVLLHGDVEIWREGGEGRRNYEVLTSELRVLPEEQYAETRHSAVIVAPGGITHAVGMKANFGHGRLELVERVRSRYERKLQQ